MHRYGLIAENDLNLLIVMMLAIKKTVKALAKDRGLRDIERGRLAVDVRLANPVRSGRKQPQRDFLRVVVNLLFSKMTKS